MPLFQQIEDALTPEEIAAMDQWATSTSEGTRTPTVDREAVRIVLAKLWNRFDQDYVDDWCDSLVQSKLAGAKE